MQRGAPESDARTRVQFPPLLPREVRVLDAWAHERRRVYLEVTAPTAQENRRRVSERDPEKRRLDAERLQRLTNDPAAAREALLAVFALVGRDPLQ